MWASLVAQMVNNLTAMQETWIQSLGWEDPLEKGRQAEAEPRFRAWPTGEEAPLALEHGYTRAAKVTPHPWPRPRSSLTLFAVLPVLVEPVAVPAPA